MTNVGSAPSSVPRIARVRRIAQAPSVVTGALSIWPPNRVSEVTERPTKEALDQWHHETHSNMLTTASMTVSCIWWRRRESNPRPKAFDNDVYMHIRVVAGIRARRRPSLLRPRGASTRRIAP